MVLGAATMAMGVGLSATAFIYSTEIYPEFPGALLLVLSLLVVTRERTMSVADGLLLAAILTAMCWLGIKYAPLAPLALLVADPCPGLLFGYNGLLAPTRCKDGLR